MEAVWVLSQRLLARGIASFLAQFEHTSRRTFFLGGERSESHLSELDSYLPHRFFQLSRLTPKTCAKDIS